MTDNEKQTRPTVSADVVAVAMMNGEPVFATYTRQWEPFIGVPALPGVMITLGETVEGACSRALEDKVGLPGGECTFVQLPFRDALSRDERSRTISLPQLAIVKDTNGICDNAQWTPISEPGDLAFDHLEILESGKKVLRDNLLTTPGLAYGLLGAYASVNEISDLLVALGDKKDKNISRKLSSSTIFQETDETFVHGAGRPRKLWELKEK